VQQLEESHVQNFMKTRLTVMNPLKYEYFVRNPIEKRWHIEFVQRNFDWKLIQQLLYIDNIIIRKLENKNHKKINNAYIIFILDIFFNFVDHSWSLWSLIRNQLANYLMQILSEHFEFLCCCRETLSPVNICNLHAFDQKTVKVLIVVPHWLTCFQFW
jgi:hypothetical protein